MLVKTAFMLKPLEVEHWGAGGDIPFTDITTDIADTRLNYLKGQFSGKNFMKTIFFLLLARIS